MKREGGQIILSVTLIQALRHVEREKRHRYK